MYGYIRVLRNKKQTKKSEPIIYWEIPVSSDTIIESEYIFIQSCIQSEDNVNIALLVDGKEYSTRDFVIKKNTNTCNVKYQQRIELKSNDKPIEITLIASNSAGKVQSKKTINVKKSKIEKKENNLTEKKLALIIGNNNYQGVGLKNAINDATDMSTALTKLGFETYLYTDLDQKGMKKSIIDFGSKLNTDCTVLFFYAGHGIQTKGTNYLIPIDAQLDREANVDIECVSMNSVLQQMESAKSKINIIILDACRNNPWERSWNRSGNQNGLGKMDAPLETIILYATQPGSTADDGGDSKNGVFTSELLNNINKPGLKIEEVFKSTSAGVRNRTKNKQIPWVEGTFIGDFYFVK